MVLPPPSSECTGGRLSLPAHGKVAFNGYCITFCSCSSVLPFDRSAAIAKLTPQQRAEEYNRAKMIALLDDSGQRSFFKQARNGSLFSAFELLAMVRRFKHVDDWRNGNLWKLLCVTCGEAVKLKNRDTAEIPSEMEIRRTLLESGKRSLEISVLAGVARRTVTKFLEGKSVNSDATEKLARCLESVA